MEKILTIIDYEEKQYANTIEWGFIAGPNCPIVAEDANRPGEFRFFKTEESCKGFCDYMNTEEGTAFFRVQYDEEAWTIVESQAIPKEEDSELELFELEMRLKGIRLRPINRALS